MPPSRTILSFNRWTKAFAFFMFWAVLGYAFASQLYLSSYYFGAPVSWQQAVRWSLADWLLWGGLSLPIWWLGSRVPLRRGLWKDSLVIHIAASLMTGFLYVFLRAWIAQLQRWWDGDLIVFESAFLPLLIKTFPVNLMIYWLVVATCQGVQHNRSLHAKTLREIELEKRLHEARLMALQMQLNPHFLFNTLHAISSLVYHTPQAAERMIMLLSDLLRHALEYTDQSLVTLESELDFLNRYLEIEQIRFGERLQIVQQIDKDTLRLHVPNLILQPLVENAMDYAVEPYARTSTVHISASLDNHGLHLSVQDDGPGASKAGPLVEGIGLSNVRARLKQLYGPRYQLHYEDRPEGGFGVWILLPRSDISPSGRTAITHPPITQPEDRSS